MMSSDLSHVPPKRTRVDPAAEWRERAERAEAQVQAVRDVCDEAVRRSRRKSLGYADHYVAVEDVQDALEGR